MTLSGHKICVLGGGIGGLAAATALARRGARVTVLERSAEIAEVGAGLQISPNGAAVLRALGLESEVAAASPRAQAVQLLDYRQGRQVLRLDLARLGADQGYYFVHRADLIGLLAGAARDAGVKIRLSQDVAQVELLADGGQRLVTGQGAAQKPGILIGADGLHSAVHAAMNGTAAPFYTGQVAWRALVPLDVAAEPVARVWMGPGRHLVQYPLRDRRLMNIVAVEDRSTWTDEGWHHPDDPANLRAAFAGFAPPVQTLLAGVETTNLWGLFRHRVAAHWHQGRAAILGDAAHPTLPFLAQGANMALEDAWVLADALDTADSIESGLASYQLRRRDRVVRVIETAGRNARNYHLSSAPLRFAAHSALRLGGAVAPGMVMSRFDWLYHHDVTDG